MSICRFISALLKMCMKRIFDSTIIVRRLNDVGLIGGVSSGIRRIVRHGITMSAPESGFIHVTKWRHLVIERI